MGVLFEGNSLSTQLEHFDRRRGEFLRPPSVCQYVGTEKHSHRLLQRRPADCERAESQFKIDQSDGSTVGAFGHRQAQHTCGRGVGVCGATVVAAGNGPFQSILQRTEVLRNLPHQHEPRHRCSVRLFWRHTDKIGGKCQRTTAERGSFARWVWSNGLQGIRIADLYAACQARVLHHRNVHNGQRGERDSIHVGQSDGAVTL